MSEGPSININPSFNFQQPLAQEKWYKCIFFNHFGLFLIYTSADSSETYEAQIGKSKLETVITVRFFAEEKTNYFCYCCQNTCVIIQYTKPEPIIELINKIAKEHMIYLFSQDYQYIKSLNPDLHFNQIPENQFNEICQEYTSIDKLFFDPLNLQIVSKEMTFSKFLFITHSLISSFYIRRNYFPIPKFTFSFPVDCPNRCFNQYHENMFFFIRPMQSQLVSLCLERTKGYLCVRKFYTQRFLYEREKAQINQLKHPKIIKENEIFHHPNIVNCFGYIDDDPNKTPSLLFEFATNSTLESLFESGKDIDDTTKSKMLYQILGALDYLHMNGIIHQNLVPENILVSTNYDVYLTHFYSSRIYLGENRFDPQQGFSFYDDLALYGVLIYEIAYMKLLWDKNEFPNTTPFQRLEFVLQGSMSNLPIEYGPIVSLYEKCVRNHLCNRISSFIYLSQFRQYYYYFYNAELSHLFNEKYYYQLFYNKNEIRKDVQYVFYQSSKEDPESLYRHALFEREGIYIAKGIRPSYHKLRKAVNLSLDEANYELIRECFNGENNGYTKQMCEIILRDFSQKEGYYKSKFLCAKCILESPEGFKTIEEEEEDRRIALDLLIEANQSVADAQIYLSDLIMEGKFFQKDEANAVDYLIEAANKASDVALFKLAFIYENGIQGVVEKNDKTALKYYFLAASLQNEDALKVLVGKYNNLNGDDKIKAYRILKIAAKQRLYTGLKFIGIMYRDWAENKDNKDTTERKQKMLYKAMLYLNIIAEQGDMDSLIDMANRYYYGNGVERNIKLAIEYYKRYKDSGGQYSIQDLENH